MAPRGPRPAPQSPGGYNEGRAHYWPVANLLRRTLRPTDAPRQPNLRAVRRDEVRVLRPRPPAGTARRAAGPPAGRRAPCATAPAQLDLAARDRDRAGSRAPAGSGWRPRPSIRSTSFGVHPGSLVERPARGCAALAGGDVEHQSEVGELEAQPQPVAPSSGPIRSSASTSASVRVERSPTQVGSARIADRLDRSPSGSSAPQRRRRLGFAIAPHHRNVEPRLTRFS